MEGRARIGPPYAGSSRPAGRVSPAHSVASEQELRRASRPSAASCGRRARPPTARDRRAYPRGLFQPLKTALELRRTTLLMSIGAAGRDCQPDQLCCIVVPRRRHGDLEPRASSGRCRPRTSPSSAGRPVGPRPPHRRLWKPDDPPSAPRRLSSTYFFQSSKILGSITL
jgi:hypothetical protein